jgi:hypothetical protein
MIDEKTVKQCNPVKQRNPTYTTWMARDQAVLGYLLSSLTHETLMHVLRCTTSSHAWRMLTDIYSSQSWARAVNTWIALVTTKKLHLSVTDYYSIMCHYADELTATRAPLHGDERIAYVLAELNEDYNLVFTAIVARTDPITSSEIYAQLLSFVQHTSLQGHSSLSASSSAMAASRDHGSTGGRGYGGSDRGHGHGRGCGCGRSFRGGTSSNDSRNSHTNSSRPQCQVCLKIRHMANNCWPRFDKDYVLEQRTAAAISSGIDQP